jgi:UDP-galactopyranose mutase
MENYDYLIIGAGLYGAVFAHEATKKGKKCLVIDKRNHIGGNIYCESVEGINVHKYGAHIFHTSDEEVWKYVNDFVVFNRFTNSPIANYKGEIYNLPFNMNTFNKLWGVITPEEAMKKIEDQRSILGGKHPENLEEQAISLVGTDIYTKLVKGYTEKQWGRKATELPPFIIRRLPVRFIYDNNYFNDKYQGIPIGGYNLLIEKLLEKVEVKVNTDYFEHRDYLNSLADKILFTGMIDKFYNYQYGILEYRTLNFETEVLKQSNFQGNAVVNYTDSETPYTRIIEHKHFEFGTQGSTVITKEYPKEWEKGDEPYYPVLDKKNTEVYNKYKALAEKEENIIFGGRLGDYRYYDMHNVIKVALQKVKEELID